MEQTARKPNRLKTFDYSTGGAYFITICTEGRRNLLSSIVGGGVLDAPQVLLSEYGRLVHGRICEMDKTYENLSVDKFVIMPNHMHLLLCVAEQGTSRTPSPTNAVIPRFVSTLKRYVHRDCGKKLFQRSYHDHVIRSQQDYDEIWTYIENNPKQWELDKYHTE